MIETGDFPRSAAAYAYMRLPTRDQQVLRYLQQVLTDFRSDLVVVLAGQPGPLRALLDGSPALAARFPYLITFPAGVGEQPDQPHSKIIRDKHHASSLPLPRYAVQAPGQGTSGS